MLVFVPTAENPKDSIGSHTENVSKILFSSGYKKSDLLSLVVSVESNAKTQTVKEC